MKQIAVGFSVGFLGGLAGVAFYIIRALKRASRPA